MLHNHQPLPPLLHIPPGPREAQESNSRASTVSGTMATGAGCLLFALINPSASYWAFGFPAAVLTVFGADFIFASGTLFVARVALPHEQSLAGGVFQTVTQVRPASPCPRARTPAVAVCDVRPCIARHRAGTGHVHDRAQQGCPPRHGQRGDHDGPPGEQRAPRRGAQGIAGCPVDRFRVRNVRCALVYFSVPTTPALPAIAALALLLAVVFLRGVGIVGHKKARLPEVPEGPTSTAQSLENEKMGN